MTQLEVVSTHHEAYHTKHFSTLDKHAGRMNYHERILLIIAAALSVLLQEQWGRLALLIKGLMM